MKSKIAAAVLFSLTITGVLAYPSLQQEISLPGPIPSVLIPQQHTTTQERPLVEVVFVLDTTGSMGGLLQAAKDKIWSIATTMASSESAPLIRMGLVAYRDRGDDYVTKVVDLSEDLDSVYARLMEFQADGGGDGPESVNQALHDAVHNITWSKRKNAYKVVFLVGDAPPHMDYPNDVKYPVSIRAAAERNIIVNTIQCGQDEHTRQQWQTMASLGQGSFFEVGQSGNAVAIATPYDEHLATLSRKLDDTRLFYGEPEEQARQERKKSATEKLHASASPASRARRATFNATVSGADNFLGEKELVNDIVTGRVELDTIRQDNLPPAVRALAPQEQKALIKKTATERKKLQDEIRSLTEQRSSYLKEKVKDQGGALGSLDHKVFNVVREQAASSGIHYEADSLDY